MLKQLNYEIAGHRLVLYTADTQKTAALLPTFYPFVSFKCYDETDDFLFSLTGNRPIELPDSAAEDKLEFDGRYSEVYRTRDGIIVTMRINDMKRHFHISTDWKNISTDLSLINREERFFLYRFIVTLFGMTSARHQTIKIHASVTELNGKALILLGKSGTGKSTHSRLWRKYVPGSTLLNDDEPILRVLEDGNVKVFGAPWSGSMPCYKNESADVAAIVHLCQSHDNQLFKLGNMGALSSFYSSTVQFRSDPAIKTMILDTVTIILEHVPVYWLDCRPDREAVMLTKSLMA